MITSSTVIRTTLAATLLGLAGVPACAQRPAAAPVSASLKDAFKDAFLVGGTLNAAHFSGRDTAGANLGAREFNAISPENTLKWEAVHPRLGGYDFSGADQFVAFGEAHKMFIVGHTLVWHNQTPQWVFRDAAGQPVSRDTLVARLRDHIHTVVGRYKARIHGWDVVNEALNEDGTLRQTPWLRIIGEDYLAMAFRFAREADPAAELYYNDYSLANPAKRAGAVALIKRLQSQGVPVYGVGLQGHHKMDWPTVAAEDSTVQAFADLGVKVMITELDIDVLPQATQNRTADVTLNVESQGNRYDPYRAGLPDSVQQALARRYAEFFAMYLKHREAITRVTFWGIADGDSWLNNWPMRGRTNHPLLFDRAHRPKPAYEAVMRVARPAPLAIP